MKSAILLAGLLRGRRRDDRRRAAADARPHRAMLGAAGVRVERGPKTASVWPAERLELSEIEIPGDFSSAAPFLVAATLLAGSQLTIHGVNLNPRRTGLLDVLKRMGAQRHRLQPPPHRRRAGRRPRRPAGRARRRRGSAPPRCRCSSTSCRSSRFSPPTPEATACVSGAAELRVKETDRIEAVVDGLRRIGAHIRATDDGFVVRGVPARLAGRHDRVARRPPHRDPRGGGRLVSREGVTIEDAESVAVSFPGFYDLLETRRRGLPVEDTRNDHRHRRTRGRGQEHGRPPPRRAARLPLPRHGRDVPRADLARAARGHPARPRRTISPRSPASTPSRSTTRTASTSTTPT